MSIEILRKGFRLDIDPAQVVTFKKSQDLNGVQNRYAYSNTIKLEKTANNIKLLGLFYLPANKLTSLKDGYTVDVVLNRSINLLNQTLKIQKENLKTVDTYLLYSDSSLVVALKELYVGQVAKKYTYNKTISDLIVNNALTETQPESGLYIIEEMPLLINLHDLIKDIFEDANYTFQGDFFNDAIFKEFFVAPNEGTYQTFTGTPFEPTFNPDLDTYTFLKSILSYFNCYIDVDDTQRVVTMNRWTNLNRYKTNFVDYSKYYDTSKDYAFTSKLAKNNGLKYTDSGTSFDSFFTNTLSSQDESTYLNSKFGTGSLNIFENVELDEFGNIPTRLEGEKGEISAVRILRKSDTNTTQTVYVGGVPNSVTAKKALPVSMQTVYVEFHKDYTDFILTPIITNIEFKYNDILAAEFSMTKVFFIEQTSSYWIPLEINYSTKKEGISVKAMLVKKRKVVSPVLNNLNSVLLDFKEKGTVPLETFKALYPMPPNKNNWDVVIFNSYDQGLNSLFINDVLIPANTLPQAFLMNDITSIKIEANVPTDTQPDTNSASIYFKAIDTDGGESNEAFINVVHTGVANLESNFAQTETIHFEVAGTDSAQRYVGANIWYQGNKPNLNDTLQVASNYVETSINSNLNVIQATEAYTNVKIDLPSFNIHMRTNNNGIGKARAWAKVVVEIGSQIKTFHEVSTVNDEDLYHVLPHQSYTFPSVPNGSDVKVYIRFDFGNARGSNSGSMSAWVDIDNFKVNISTTKTV